MTITYTNTGLDAASYDALLKKFLLAEEGEKFNPYVDTNGVPTIGWGFALSSEHIVSAGVLNSILKNVLKVNAISGLSQTAQDRETYYYGQLTAALNTSWPANATTALQERHCKNG